MKRQVLSLALSTLFGLGVALAAPQTQDQVPPPQSAPDSAQQAAGHRQADPNRQLQMLTKRLQLTSDQQSKILPILTNRAQQMESLRSDTSLSPQDRRSKMGAIHQDSDTQVRAVLNDKQKQNYDQMQQKMRERMQERRDQRQNSGTGTGTL